MTIMIIIIIKANIFKCSVPDTVIMALYVLTPTDPYNNPLRLAFVFLPLYR